MSVAARPGDRTSRKGPAVPPGFAPSNSRTRLGKSAPCSFSRSVSALPFGSELPSEGCQRNGRSPGWGSPTAFRRTKLSQRSIAFDCRFPRSAKREAIWTQMPSRAASAPSFRRSAAGGGSSAAAVLRTPRHRCSDTHVTPRPSPTTSRSRRTHEKRPDGCCSVASPAPPCFEREVMRGNHGTNQNDGTFFDIGRDVQE